MKQILNSPSDDSASFKLCNKKVSGKGILGCAYLSSGNDFLEMLICMLCVASNPALHPKNCLLSV